MGVPALKPNCQPLSNANRTLRSGTGTVIISAQRVRTTLVCCQRDDYRDLPCYRIDRAARPAEFRCTIAGGACCARGVPEPRSEPSLDPASRRVLARSVVGPLVHGHYL